MMGTMDGVLHLESRLDFERRFRAEMEKTNVTPKLKNQRGKILTIVFVFAIMALSFLPMTLSNTIIEPSAHIQAE
jgi:hypothetical protein